MKKNKQDIVLGVMSFFTAIVCFCLVVNIWNVNFTIPLSYSGDLSGLLINVKSMLRDEKWWCFNALGAPFSTNMWRQMWDGVIPNILIFIFAKITNSVGLSVNLYYVLTFGLSALCAYYMLRKCEIGRRYSFIGAVIYALIPGHFLRGERHLFVGSCFAIPLVMVAGFNLYSAKACKKEYVDKKKLSFGELIRSNSKEQLLGLLFLMIVSFCTIYYGIFALMYLTFCAFMYFMDKRQMRVFFYYIEYVLVEIICIAIVYIPEVLANKYDPLLEEVEIVTRSMNDVELYAGKLIQYVLPIRGHRVPFLAYFRSLYDASFFTLNNENAFSTLGLAMSIGLIMGIIICFTHKTEWAKKILKYGKIELFLFILSTVGGLSAFVGLINYNLRCYNRFSYFIGAAGIVIFCILIETLEEKVMGTGKKPNNTAIVILLEIMVIAVLDQTTVGMAFSADTGGNIKSQYMSDNQFVKDIETYEGADADILVFPVMDGWESSMGMTRDGHVTGYNEQMLFIQSETSRWSTNGKPGEKSERWRAWLENHSHEEQINIAAISGFEGIAICYTAYDEDKLAGVLEVLNNTLGEPDILDKKGNWAYYSIADEREKLLSIYDEKELESLKQLYLEDFCNEEN